jgi:deazaflavin-dependent oxidoreductase (nitroreductase family)
MNGNDFVKFFLKTPLHVFLGNTMLITVTGCKTGRTYSTPVGFYRDGDGLWILTSRDRTWWRNVRKGAHVSLVLRGRTVAAFARAEMDEGAVEALLVEYLRHMPLAAKPMGIRMEQKSPNLDDVRRAARERLFVRVQPER